MTTNDSTANPMPTGEVSGSSRVRSEFTASQVIQMASRKKVMATT